MKKVIFILVCIFALGSIVYIACNKETILPDSEMFGTNENANNLKSDELMCGTSTFTLWAGQTINAGTLVVSNDQTNLYVTYTTTGVFNQLHLWVGTDLSLLPVNPQGIPVPGQFPYTFDASGLNTYIFTIPLSSIPVFNKCGDVINVVAHGEVTINGGNETCFGGDICLKDSRWYCYAAYQTVCCTEPPLPPSSEKLGTAFAKGGWVFTTDKKSNPENLPSLDLTKNRWGWAINILTPGIKTYDIWVGAGLNNISNGKKAGTATVNYSGSQAVVTFNMLNGFSVEEVHIYANDMKPTKLAPGSYGNIFYYNPVSSTFTTTIDVSNTDSDGIWLIIHAIVWGSI